MNSQIILRMPVILSFSPDDITVYIATVARKLVATNSATIIVSDEVTPAAP